MKTLEDFKREIFKRPGVRKAYAEMQPEFQIIRKLALARSKKGFSQRKLAKKIGITQSALARFETGNINPTLSFIQKITSGLGLKSDFFSAKIRTLTFDNFRSGGKKGKGLGGRNFCPPSLFHRRRISRQLCWHAAKI